MIKIEISLDKINYGEIADTFIPVLIDKLSSKEESGRFIQILNGLDGIPGSLARTALNTLPEHVKEEMAVYFMDKYKDKIIDFVNDFAEENQIKAEVDHIKILREPKIR